jgi:hypothetical protein
MATYLQGVTDYIPDYQPFQPDLNFYSNVLQTKQTQYDSNWKSLNNLYADLHNADLTHDQNIKKKDDLLKQIDFNLKRVTGLDLSLQQNVDQATQVFRPFYEDKYLMKDMAWTKNYSSTVSRALNLKNSQDEKMRAQYWDTGIKDMQYRKEEFKDSTLEETLNMGNVSYTPYVNSMEKYLKLAKETGLSIDIKDVDDSGLYFVREKNGKALLSPLQNLFMSAYANDPALQAVYATQSYVKRKDYAEQHATKFNGNKVEAEKEYLKEQYKFLQNYTAKKNGEAKEAVDVNKNKTTSTEKDRDNNEANPFTESYFESLNKALAIDETVANHAEKLDKDINGGNSSTVATSGVNGDPNVLDLNDLELARLRVDGGTASILAEQDILGAADIYAYKDYVYEKSANPVGLENLRQQNALARIDYTHKLKEDEIKLKAGYDLEKVRIANGVANGTITYDKDGNMQEDDGGAKPLTLGSTSGQFADEIDVLAENAKSYNETISNLTGTYIGNTLLRLKQLTDRGEITNQEAWKAVSWLDPNSKDAQKRYGTKDGKKLVDQLWKKYQNNNDKFILDFTKTNQVLKLKKFMDGWSSNNSGHKIAIAYHGDSSGLNMQKYAIYKEQAKVIEKGNYEKITKNLAEYGMGNLKPEAKEMLAKLYIKYKDKDNGEEYFNKEAAKIIKTYDTSRKFEFNGRAGLDASMLQSLTPAELAQWRKISGIKSGDVTNMNTQARKYLYGKFGYNPQTRKKIGESGDNLFDDLSNVYTKTITATGPEGLDSFEGFVRTKGGRYSLGTNEYTSKDVYLNNPGWGGFTDFQQGMADINRIRFSQNPDKYAVTYGGLTKNAAENESLDPAEMKAMLRELQMSAGKKSKTGGFKIARSSVALENPNLKALIIIPPQAFLLKYIKDDKGAIDYAKIRKIKSYGISFIAPKNEWTNDFINENELTPTEQIINASGEMRYQHGNGAGGFTIAKVKNVPGVDYSFSYEGKLINDDGTVSIKKDYLPFQKSGNKIDDTQTAIFDMIQTINEQNLAKFRHFQETGNQKAIDNVHKYYKQPDWSGFKY